MPNLNSSRIVDLSTLAPKPPSSAPAGAAGSYVTEVDEAGFDAVARLSMEHPVVVEFYSPRAGAQEMSDTLTKLANAADGKYLLARINVDASPELAKQLQIQAVPLVVAILGGQLVPLWQGTADEAKAQAVLDQLVQLAAQNGIMGRAKPVAAPAPEGEEADAEEPAVDPRFAAADAAIEAGDYATAEAEFDKLIAQNPADAEAQAGRAQVALLARATQLDAEATLAAAKAAPEDVDAQLAAADVEMLLGDAAGAFSRLIGVVRDCAGDDRERARVRLLELFQTADPADPAVLKARRDLTSALF